MGESTRVYVVVECVYCHKSVTHTRATALAIVKRLKLARKNSRSTRYDLVNFQSLANVTEVGGGLR
jgi:hypothetical protein